MGCDIHEMIEVRNSKRMELPGYWENAGTAGLHRNYTLFSIIGNVRNDNPKIPFIGEHRIRKSEDTSFEFKAWLQLWRGDAHSASFVTLKELKDFLQKHKDTKVYDPSLVLKRDKEGEIAATCASTNGPHLGPVGEYSIFGPWGSGFFEDVIKKLEDVKTFHGLESDDDIRLVFFFDN